MEWVPEITAPADLVAVLKAQGHAALAADGLTTLIKSERDALERWLPTWSELPADGYLRDGGHYRRRRHSCFVVDGVKVAPQPHRAHWQPVDYNALHGGLERWFEPIEPSVTSAPAWSALLAGLGGVASGLRGVRRWFIEAHQFRIDTAAGIGRPTPEGAHRDGVDLVAVVLVDRAGVKGGETRVFDADGPTGIRFTMVDRWTTLLIDDGRVVHETTPIQPLLPQSQTNDGHRDTLVLTFRADAFQGPPTG